jgi:hypothetical protein
MRRLKIKIRIKRVTTAALTTRWPSIESKHFVTPSASADESPLRQRPGETAKPCDKS